KADQAPAERAPGTLSSSAIKTRRRSIAKSRLYENLGHTMGISVAMKRSETPPIVVCGAGPAGATAARRLALGGRRVQLLYRRAFPRQKPCGGGISVRALSRFPYLERELARIATHTVRRLYLEG